MKWHNPGGKTLVPGYRARTGSPGPNRVSSWPVSEGKGMKSVEYPLYETDL
jgi:hypothetical protein